MTKDELRKTTEYEVEVIRLKYETELRREESLIQQAGRMQSAFAFSTAALFMGMPVMFQYRGRLSFGFVLAAVSSITIVLMISLFASLMAQNRRMQKMLPNGKDFIKYLEDKEEYFDSEEKRNKYLAETFSEIQESITLSNTKRVFWVRISMWFFYAALADCFFWFIVALIKVFILQCPS